MAQVYTCLPYLLHFWDIWLRGCFVFIASDEWAAGSQVAAVLESLAVRRASGVLEIDGDPAGELVRGGFVSADELRAVVTSVIVDAVTVLTAPVAGEASVSGFRFEEPRAHWAGGLVRLDAARVFAEADERARRMARKGLGLESAGRPPVTSELLQRVLAGLRKLS